MSERWATPHWKCTIGDCNKPADYHECVDGVHEYFCTEHWWLNLKRPPIISDAEIVERNRKNGVHY